MRAPFFSLIVCTYGRTDVLGKLFHSLAGQVYKDFEVIVVDQNCDNRVAPYLQLAHQLRLELRYVKRLRPNLSAARNVGIQISEGRWIGFPDDDCWYEPETLKLLHDRICERQVGGIASLQWSEFPQVLDRDLSWARSRRFRDPLLASFMLFMERNVFQQIGFFNPVLGVGQWFSAGEETDLVFRAVRHGVSGFFEPEALVHHPVKDFAGQPGGKSTVRCRARGAGAIYAIHDIPAHVVLRGLIAPFIHSLRRPGRYPMSEAIAEVTGRFEGMAVWMTRDVLFRSRRVEHMEAPFTFIRQV